MKSLDRDPLNLSAGGGGVGAFDCTKFRGSGREIISLMTNLTTIPLFFVTNNESERREELVEVEWEGVELLAAWVCLEGPESVPEMVSTIFPGGAIAPGQGVVQEQRHGAPNECF
jgi:hypothetical protein